MRDKKPTGAAPGFFGEGRPDRVALKFTRALRRTNAGTATDKRSIGVETIHVPKPSASDPGVHRRNGDWKFCLIHNDPDKWITAGIAVVAMAGEALPLHDYGAQKRIMVSKGLAEIVEGDERVHRAEHWKTKSAQSFPVVVRLQRIRSFIAVYLRLVCKQIDFNDKQIATLKP